MTAQLMASPFSYFADANGAPLNGGLVYTYTAGTTTPKATYTDSTAGTPAANPVVLDSGGKAEIWLVGSYKIVVKDSLGNTIHTTDNVIEGNMLSSIYDAAGVNEQLVGLTATQTLSNKSATTQTANTSSLLLANMAAVQQSQVGGFINKFRNPTFDVANRGTTGTTTSATGVYSLDGWIVGSDGTRTLTWTQVYGNVGTYYGNLLQLTGASSTTDTFVKQRIESTVATPLAGKVVTFQMSVTPSGIGTLSPTITVKHPTAKDNWTSTVTDVSAVALQTGSSGVIVLSYTFTAAANTTNGLEITVDFGSYLNGGAQNVYLGAADLRITPGVAVGLNSTPPVPEGRPISIEQQICQRYLPAFLSSSTTSIVGFGSGGSTTTVNAQLSFFTPARIAPTGITVSNAVHMTVNDGVTPTVSTAIVGDFYSTSCANILITVASGLTQFRPYLVYFNNASGSIIFTGAEL